MGKAGKADEVVREEPLTAVLLADSFSMRMRPVTIERPKVLLPLVNCPMIEYMLEWLAASGVAIVHVVCCSHAEQIKAHLAASCKWHDSSMAINIITSYNCVSAGEALRIVDQAGLIRDDFILIRGDTVTNMDLQEALREHKARREKDKAAIMTLVASGGVDEAQRILMGISNLIIVMDRTTKRLLAYHNYSDDTRSGGAVDIDTTLFSERGSVDIRYDLSDANIYVCAPEVLLLFSDNFDFQHLQRDFITGVLSEEELGNKLFVHELRNTYAAHVTNLRAYATVSQDILARWIHPLAPDSNLLPAAQQPDVETAYFFGRDYIYKESSVTIERTAAVRDNTCIGYGTRVGASSAITRSVIGRGCQIGTNVIIQDSFIMGNVTIRDGARVTSAFICDGVTVGANAVVSPGCVISFNCVIGASHVVPAHARITLCTATEDALSVDSSVELEAAGRTQALDDSDDGLVEVGPTRAVLEAAERARRGAATEETFDTHAVGAGGAGFDYHRQLGTAPSPLDELTSIALPSVAIAEQRVALLCTHNAAGAAAADEEGDTAEIASDPESIFRREVQETLLRTMTLAQGSEAAKREMTENAVIELNALKIAEVRTFADCARYLLTTIMDLQSVPGANVAAQFRPLYAAAPPDVSSVTGQLALLRTFTATLDAWAPILRKFLREDEDQIELLLTLEEYCGGRGVFAGADVGRLYVPIFSHVLVQLYEKDVITEDVALLWEAEKAEDDEEDQEFLLRAKDFLDWLKRDEDDEESEGDLGDESDDESDASD